MFPVAAERVDDAVVPRGKQLAADQPLRPVFPQLYLVFGVPSRVVAHHSDERQSISNGSIVLHDMESGCAVSQDRHDPRARPSQSRSDGERN